MRHSLFLDSGAADGGAPVVPTGPAPTAIESAVASAREAIAARESGAAIVAPPAPPAPVAPVAAPAEGAAVPQDGPTLGRATPPAGAVDWSAVDWATADLAAMEAADPTLLFIPPRRPGQPPVPVQLNQPELVEDMRRWRNDGMRGAEFAEAQADLAAREEHLHDMYAALRVDPVGFILSRVAPEDQTRVAMSILTHREVWPNIVKTLQSLIGDPRHLEATRARLENANLLAERDARDAVLAEREARQNGADLRKAVHALVPNGLTREQAKLWRDAARQALRDYATRGNLRTIDVRDVPSILAAHLSAFNVAPEEAWARMRAAFLSGGQPPAATPIAAPLAAAAPSGSAPPSPRQAAAMIAPAGAGAAPATMPTPPKGQTVEERMEWVKQQGVLRRA